MLLWASMASGIHLHIFPMESTREVSLTNSYFITYKKFEDCNFEDHCCWHFDWHHWWTEQWQVHRILQPFTNGIQQLVLLVMKACQRSWYLVKPRTLLKTRMKPCVMTLVEDQKHQSSQSTFIKIAHNPATGRQRLHEVCIKKISDIQHHLGLWTTDCYDRRDTRVVYNWQDTSQQTGFDDERPEICWWHHDDRSCLKNVSRCWDDFPRTDAMHCV